MFCKISKNVQTFQIILNILSNIIFSSGIANVIIDPSKDLEITNISCFQALLIFQRSFFIFRVSGGSTFFGHMAQVRIISSIELNTNRKLPQREKPIKNRNTQSTYSITKNKAKTTAPYMQKQTLHNNCFYFFHNQIGLIFIFSGTSVFSLI